jgi:alpha-N-acetylglucosamine transferase
MLIHWPTNYLSGTMSVGFDHMDLHELKARNIKVQQSTKMSVNYITNWFEIISEQIQNLEYRVNVFFGFTRSDSLRTYWQMQLQIWQLPCCWQLPEDYLKPRTNWESKQYLNLNSKNYEQDLSFFFNCDIILFCPFK